MITLEINIIPNTRMDMQLSQDGIRFGECKDLPLLVLTSGNRPFTVPHPGKAHIEVDVKVERTAETKEIVFIEVKVTLSVTQPNQYHPKVTEVYNGKLLQNEVSIPII